MWHGILLAGLLLFSQGSKVPSAHDLDSAAAALMAKGRIIEAEAKYRKALEIDPQDADALNNLGVILRRKAQPGLAIDFLRRAASVRPNDPRIRSNLALALQEAGRLNEAIVELRQAT